MTCHDGPPRAAADGLSLANSVNFDLVGPELGRSVRNSLETAIEAGAVFPRSADPLSIFRDALAVSIRNIESHPRGKLFQRFLSIGPLEDEGKIPRKLRGERLTDDEVASVVTFIHSHMVNCFKGAVAELLALGPLTRLVTQLQCAGEISETAQIYVGDAVRVRRPGAAGYLKGADVSILVDSGAASSASRVAVAGVAEVKSYLCSEQKLIEQLDSHLARARNGLWVAGRDIPSERVQIGAVPRHRALRIAVLPSQWLLPRTFHFTPTEHNRALCVDPPNPPAQEDEVVRKANGMWRVVLRWSSEALAAAAYDMTFFYMGEVGKVVFHHSRPRGLQKMAPAAAGRSVATQMLHYAMIRSRSRREYGRVVDLYNVYGFGYALGMNFRNESGEREVLFPRDLDEILAVGRTTQGCFIRGYPQTTRKRCGNKHRARSTGVCPGPVAAASGSSRTCPGSSWIVKHQGISPSR